MADKSKPLVSVSDTLFLDNGDGTYMTNDSYANIAGAGTTVVKSGAGRLKRIIVNKAVAAGVITVYDNTAASGTLIATITSPVVLLNNQFVLNYDCRFDTGLTIVTSAADNVTVIYS